MMMQLMYAGAPWVCNFLILTVTRFAQICTYKYSKIDLSFSSFLNLYFETFNLMHFKYRFQHFFASIFCWVIIIFNFKQPAVFLATIRHWCSKTKSIADHQSSSSAIHFCSLLHSFILRINLCHSVNFGTFQTKCEIFSKNNNCP